MGVLKVTNIVKIQQIVHQWGFYLFIMCDRHIVSRGYWANTFSHTKHRAHESSQGVGWGTSGDTGPIYLTNTKYSAHESSQAAHVPAWVGAGDTGPIYLTP